MSDPSRLVNGDAAFESAVLRAWRDRQPSDAARMKTLTAVGLAGGVVAASGSAAAGIGGSVAPKALVASSSLLKWLAIAGGLAATAGVIGYATLSTKPADAPRGAIQAPVSSAPASAPVPASASVPSGSTGASGTTGAAERALPTPSIPATHAATVTGAAGASPKAVPALSPASSLDEEVVAIDQARRALAGGDAQAALQLVDAYDAKYPNGALYQESTGIRIQALYRTGKRAMADKLAASFLAAHPTSPYARAIRALQAGAVTPAP
jgi:hypothetical protein